MKNTYNKFKVSFDLILEADEDNTRIKDYIEDFLDNLDMWEVVGIGDLTFESIGPASVEELEEFGIE